MIVSGKIHSIDLITQDITNIVLVKSRNKKQYFISILFYYHFSDVVKKEYLADDFIEDTGEIINQHNVKSSREDNPNR